MGTQDSLGSRDPEKAIALLKTALEMNPGRADPHLHLVSILANRNRMDEARASVREIRRLDPGYSIRDLERGWMFKDPDGTLLKGASEILRKCGLPEE